MSVVCVGFIAVGLIVLTARECASEWREDFGDGKESICVSLSRYVPQPAMSYFLQ